MSEWVSRVIVAGGALHPLKPLWPFSEPFPIASDGGVAASCSLGQASWRTPTDVDGTRLVQGEPRERRNDGHADGRRLTKLSGELEQDVALLEHRSTPDADV